jgi:hypothetical protein
MARGCVYTPEIGNCRKVTSMNVNEHTENSITFNQESLAFVQADTLVSNLIHTIP